MLVALDRLLENPSIELVFLVVAVVTGAFLATVVLFSDRKNRTNQIFALLALFTIFWLVTNYLVHSPRPFIDPLLLHRFGIFLAAPMSALFFLLAHTIPAAEIRLRWAYLRAVLISTAAMMLLNISPYAFTSISVTNGTLSPIPGPGLIPFAILSTLFSVLAVYHLIQKFVRSEGVSKKQIRLVLTGIVVMLVLIIVTILVPVAFFSSVKLLPLTPLYVLAFLSMTAYAITKYQLFNIKVLVTQALTFVILVILFAKIFGGESQTAQIIDVLVLIFTAIFGYFLVRSVQREVEQREEIEKLSAEKSEFMTFASHEIRNPITAMRGYASLIADGTTGEVEAKTKDAAQKILVEGNNVLSLIATFLNKSKMELGQISYDSREFDLGAAVTAIANGYRPHAEQKGLELLTDIHQGHEFTIKADEGKVKEVIGNLIDNSLKYTRQGHIKVSVERHGVHVRAIIADTGVGIAPQTLPHLFKKFSRADAQKVNLLGTGVGLYLAKTFIEAMGGRVWAESGGEGEGSRFIVEFKAA